MKGEKIILMCVLVFCIYSFLRRNYKLTNNNISHRILEKMDTLRADNIIVLGDSIFKNNIYVGRDESIEFLLNKKVNRETKIQFLAEDGALIENVLNSQMPNIKPVKPNEITYIYLSAGGNDILESLFVFNDPDELREIFKEYKNMVKGLLSDYSFAFIYLSTIYYPVAQPYKKYHKIISKWNNMLRKFVTEENNTKLNIFNTDKYVFEKKDFTNSIEPSVRGGKKLVTHILT